ncbi:MAG: hypothetical protein HND48_25480 [Chloroflexi bacterium]|nr:hypothetical protein [Chloroflexota bacterium]
MQAKINLFNKQRTASEIPARRWKNAGALELAQSRLEEAETRAANTHNTGSGNSQKEHMA